MNILKFKNKASEIAHQLLTEATQNEPTITKDVKKVAELCKAKVVGLRKKIKTIESLSRKLTDKSNAWHIPIYVMAKKVNDVLRYTFLISEKDYADSFEKIKTLFEQKSYQTRKVFNAWKLENTDDDTGYRGINLTIISSNQQKFELQLHTNTSFKLKTETHGLYEESRNPKTSKKRQDEITEIMKGKAAKINRPTGV